MYKPINQREKETKMLKDICKRSEMFMARTKVGQFPTYVIKPDDLTNGEKEVLFNSVYLVGLNAFIQNSSVEMEKDIYDHLFGEDVLYITFSNSIDWRCVDVGEPRAIAFLGFRDIQVENENMLYISGICVDPSYQGYGIGSALMKEAEKRGEYQLTSLRTQNPVMKQAFDNIAGGFSYPNGAKVPEDIKKIGKLLANKFGAEKYAEHNLFCREAYGSSLYGIAITSHNNISYNEKFAELNRDAGDAMFCIKRC